MSVENNDNIKLENIQDHYQFLKVLVESIESDVLKSEKGNKSASVRLRKNLRLLKTSSQNFIRFTLDKD